jgi:hypothetical protein
MQYLHIVDIMVASLDVFLIMYVDLVQYLHFLPLWSLA